MVLALLKEMKNLHVAVIEGYEECLVSYTEFGLREQVVGWLAGHSLPAPTDEEWAVCILATEDKDVIPAFPAVLGSISYYQTESRLED